MPDIPASFRPKGRDKQTTLKQSRQDHDQQRGSSAARGYDAAWQKLRANYVRHHPLCEDCLKQNIYTAVEEVHHIKSVHQYPEHRLAWDNLVSLCKEHHVARHVAMTKL